MNDEASKLKGAFWLLGACVLAAAFAFGVAPLIRAIPFKWEQALARHIPSVSTSEVCEPDAKADAALQRLVKRLYPLDDEDRAMPIEIHIVNDPAINAFAELGGKILVNSGLLQIAESPDEVAGVLAHEIEHVHRRHILEGVLTRLLTAEGIQIVLGDTAMDPRWARYFLDMHFTRQQEEEADAGGLARLQRAHIDNRGLKRLFERFQRMEEEGTIPPFLSNHPSGEDRVHVAERFENRDTKSIMTQKEWAALKNYCK